MSLQCSGIFHLVMCLYFLKILYIYVLYIYNMNKDLYLFFFPVVPTVGLETELEEVAWSPS